MVGRGNRRGRGGGGVGAARRARRGLRLAMPALRHGVGRGRRLRRHEGIRVAAHPHHHRRPPQVARQQRGAGARWRWQAGDLQVHADGQISRPAARPQPSSCANHRLNGRKLPPTLACSPSPDSDVEGARLEIRILPPTQVAADHARQTGRPRSSARRAARPRSESLRGKAILCRPMQCSTAPRTARLSLSLASAELTSPQQHAELISFWLLPSLPLPALVSVAAWLDSREREREHQ